MSIVFIKFFYIVNLRVSNIPNILLKLLDNLCRGPMNNVVKTHARGQNLQVIRYLFRSPFIFHGRTKSFPGRKVIERQVTLKGKKLKTKSGDFFQNREEPIDVVRGGGRGVRA